MIRRAVPSASGRLGRILLPLAAGVALALGVARPAAAQTLEDYDYEYLAFRGIGFDVGKIWPSNLEQTVSYRLRVDLGYLGPGVRILPTLTYWKTDIQQDEIQAFERQLESRGATNVDLGTIELSDLAIGVDAQFVWTTPFDLLGYLGAGVALHALNGQGEVIDNTFIEDLFDSFMPGLAAIGGVEYPVLDRLRIYGEARYNMVSDIAYPSLSVGAAIMLPTKVRGEG